MAYNSIMNTVYNHYLTTYAPKKTSSQYDTHKKSELRSIYNSMVKLNKDAPLYLFDTSKESREFAVGLKENARLLRNTIVSLGGVGDDEMFQKKTAYSSNPDMVDASYIGEPDGNTEVPSFTIEVTGLATSQENLGTILPSDNKISLSPDTYSFDITINDLSYEFQYNIHEGETNRDVQERLSRLINKADIGVNADILEDGKGNSALRLTSSSDGVKAGRDTFFHVSDNHTSKIAGTVDYLGLDFVSRKPSNAEFLLNGEPRTASTNHFTIDNTYELTLKGVHTADGDASTIGLKTDLESLTENVGNLIGGYNSFIRSAAQYQELHPKSSQLIGEMKRMSAHYLPGLAKLGVSFEEDGQLSMDENAFHQGILSDEDFSSLSNMKDFTNAVLRKTNQISLNPMEYIDKTIVAYKNPGHNFSSPYVTSNYSGMLFNSYC